MRPALGLEADAGNHVHLTADEHASVVVRYEERIEVVDAVARQAAHAEDRGLRFLVVADAGQIGLAPAVDLGRANHGVAATAPHALEHPLEAQVTGILGHVIAERAEWNRLFDQERLAVGHQQFRAVAEFGQARAQARDHAQARGDHFAVAAPGLAGGDDHQLGEGEITGSRHFHPPQNTGRGNVPKRSAPPFLSW
ncbi:hypothetical protein D3C85_1065530 [compost metagenome]